MEPLRTLQVKVAAVWTDLFQLVTSPVADFNTLCYIEDVFLCIYVQELTLPWSAALLSALPLVNCRLNSLRFMCSSEVTPVPLNNATPLGINRRNSWPSCLSWFHFFINTKNAAIINNSVRLDSFIFQLATNSLKSWQFQWKYRVFTNYTLGCVIVLVWTGSAVLLGIFGPGTGPKCIELLR